MNTPLLSDTDESRAPWNQGSKTVTLDATVSVVLSKSMPITLSVPDDVDEDNLKEYIYNNKNLNSEFEEQHNLGIIGWTIDDLDVELD